MNKIWRSLVLVSVFINTGLTVHGDQSYEANWESLARHIESPQWFQDAKFGIYFHWGPYSVPAYGNEHYPRTLYGHVSGHQPKPQKNREEGVGIGFQSYREHEFHIEKFGEPKDFQYHDLFPLFTANSFDPEQWADLFFLAGAKFAGPVAIHHDGYAMWDSKLNPWNSLKTGPKRDITKELAKSIRSRGMKFITTFHHAKVGRYPERSELKHKRRWHYYGRERYLQRRGHDGQDDPELSKLYGTMGWEEFLPYWNELLYEVIDQYQPDIIWFDSWLDRLPQSHRAEFAAYYLNAAQQWGKEVVITYKQNDLPQNLGIEDFEKGRLDQLTAYSWLTDDTISAGSWTTTGSWSYTEELDIKSSRELLHGLIDIVSKNGSLLLNISPTADGIIPPSQQKSLLEIGQWLRANGEAIYGTRPFVCYGEGPKRLTKAGHFTQMDSAYNHHNIRYTTKGNTIYAIQMGWSGSGQSVMLKNLASTKLASTVIKKVSCLSSSEDIDWDITTEGLRVRTPFKAPNKTAIVFAIETHGWKSMKPPLNIKQMSPVVIDG